MHISLRRNCSCQKSRRALAATSLPVILLMSYLPCCCHQLLCMQTDWFHPYQQRSMEDYDQENPFIESLHQPMSTCMRNEVCQHNAMTKVLHMNALVVLHLALALLHHFQQTFTLLCAFLVLLVHASHNSAPIAVLQ